MINILQVQVVTDSEFNSEEVQTIVGSLQRAVKPRDGADKDAQGVGAESIVASAAPSKLSGLCASLARQVQTEILSQKLYIFHFSCELLSCIVTEENNIVHFDFFLFHQQSDDHCELAIIDLVGSS